MANGTLKIIKESAKISKGIFMGLPAMFAGSACKESTNSFCQAYGFDVFAPMALYYVLDCFNQILGEPVNKYIRGVVTFAIPATMELGQKFGLYHGAYDSRDFLAYATGVLLSMGTEIIADKILSNRSKEGKLITNLE